MKKILAVILTFILAAGVAAGAAAETVLELPNIQDWFAQNGYSDLADLCNDAEWGSADYYGDPEGQYMCLSLNTQAASTIVTSYFDEYLKIPGVESAGREYFDTGFGSDIKYTIMCYAYTGSGEVGNIESLLTFTPCNIAVHYLWTDAEHFDLILAMGQGIVMEGIKTANENEGLGLEGLNGLLGN